MEVPQAQNKAPPTNGNARPWPRGVGASSSSAPPPPPPKVYRVEPREFRDLVQRLTGAPPTALRRPPQQNYHHRSPLVQPQPVRAAGGEHQAYGAAPAPPWFAFPMAGGLDTAAGQPQHGAFL